MAARGPRTGDSVAVGPGAVGGGVEARIRPGFGSSGPAVAAILGSWSGSTCAKSYDGRFALALPE